MQFWDRNLGGFDRTNCKRKPKSRHMNAKISASTASTLSPIDLSFPPSRPSIKGKKTAMNKKLELLPQPLTLRTSRPTTASATLTTKVRVTYNIVVPIDPRDQRYSIHNNSHGNKSILAQLPAPLRFLLYICLLNLIWLIFFSSQHLEDANQHQLILGGSNAGTFASRALRAVFRPVDAVLVVIVSNRLEGILPTVSSILTHTTSKPVDLVLIGDHKINEQVRQHFLQPTDSGQRAGRLHHFISLTVQDVQDDLVQQGYHPIWMWPEWGSSRSPDWRNNNTLHVADWDQLETHAHELNHLRFYLPHMKLFQDRTSLYFLDDDILVRRDLGHAADQTLQRLADNKGLVTPCNIWIWNNDCHHFEFQDEKTIKPILEMPSLYGDRKVCQSEVESHCYPENFKDFLESVLPKSESNSNPKDQKAWNFGFSLFALENWRKLDLTEKYEAVMKESYRNHVFPETSLTFGLGVAYLAFAGFVECWNDNDVKVRDGLGFIEWNRLEHTFGEGFFDKIDVLHYTGPHKPWVANTTIESRILEPWLQHMKMEKMTIPHQFSSEPTTKLFTLLASDRTGAQWIMNTLDMHPNVCATGEAGRPESGFPTEVLLPSGVTWEPTCSIKRGCTLQFVHDAVMHLADTMDLRSRTGRVPARCHPGRDPSKDQLGLHLPRICNFVQALEHNFTDVNIERLWVEAFRDENADFLGCSCKRGTEIKGVKVLGGWLTYKNFPFHSTGSPDLTLTDTALKGSKVIRLKRRNLWAQYKSLLLAQKSDVFHLTTPGQKENQLDKAGMVTIDVEEMLTKLIRMNATDNFSDKWAEEHGSEVLHVYYEDCRDDTESCFERIFQFLEVDPSFVNKQAEHFESIFAKFHVDHSLDNVVNRGAVQEALSVNGWSHFLAETGFSEVQLLIYDETETLDKTHQFHQEKGINAIVFGQFNGGEHETKFAAAVPFLRDLPADALVVLSDNSDVRIRFPVGNDFLRFEAIDNFRSAFKEITRNFPGAVVASTESHCCASALTHAVPGQYFYEDGRRNERACRSGQPGCEWAGDEKAWPWQLYMQELAVERSGEKTEDQYLDASLIAGTAGNLLRLIAAVHIGREEDDRAVLTDYMYLHPDAIVLDYGQKLFGRNREGIHGEVNEKCPFTPETSVATARKLSTDSQHVPSSIFVHSPRFLGCSSGEKVKEQPVFPRWNDHGVDIEPVLAHLDRVAAAQATITYEQHGDDKPQYYQGPEIPYFVDEKGLWTSKLIRDRTDQATLEWRTLPTEALIRMAHKIIITGGPENESRWGMLMSSIRSGGFPYWAWYGDFKSCNTRNYKAESIPLMTTSAMADCADAFPVPNYMNIIDSQKNSDHWRGLFRDTDIEFPWEKKIRKVVWRGSLSEADYRKALTSVRWRANLLIHNLQSDKYDVGLTSIPTWITDHISVDVSLVGGLVENISPMRNYQNYMAILDLDGNSWSSRFASLLCYNSVVIKVEPKYMEYFYADLKPYTHYLPVKGDLSDLHEIVSWTLDPQNEGTVRDIITAAHEWCAQRMTPDELAKDLLDIWQAYVRLLDRADPQWQRKWLEKKDDIFSQGTNLDLIQLKN